MRLSSSGGAPENAHARAYLEARLARTELLRCCVSMEKLDNENRHSSVASNDMCTFAVVNMAFAPIFPVMAVQIRTDAGSCDPYSIVLPSAVTAVATITVSIIACKYFEKKGKRL